jgi:hypothetical protein
MPWSTYDSATPDYRANVWNWQYGTPWQGDYAVRPRIDFGDGTVWNGLASRYFVTSISSVAWIPVAHLGTETENGYFLARLLPTGNVFPWERGPQHHFVTVRVEVKIAPPLPAGFPGTPTVHVAWYDPDNTVANVPAAPPAHDGHGLRDNKGGRR